MGKMTIGHLARVEGHGGITVHIDGEKVTRVDMDVYEGSRLYEALLVGKRYSEVASITSRVCGICSAGHALCATFAVEDAFGVPVPPTAKILRDLLIHGENIESHALHFFFLALPDFFGKKSVLHLQGDAPELVSAGVSLKKLGNRIQEIVGGRPVHPVNLCPGGLVSPPSPGELRELLSQMENHLDNVDLITSEVEKVKVPELLSREATFVALTSDEPDYPFTGEKIKTSAGEEYPLGEFRRICHERVVRHSTAKQSLYSGKPFMVGALARIVINGEKLGGKAREVRERLLPPDPSRTPLHNNNAQFVELVHSLEESARLIRVLLDSDTSEVRSGDVIPREGSGIGALEVPRGTLYHYYEFDGEGKVRDAEIITPTAQNLANIESDLTICAENAPLENRLEVVRRLEMVARAYDPCISCSVHIIRKEERGERSG
ncbi:MAG: Ni/Fe hydrogenase subunit alpha [Deltaproteobacteria bacterium]|nr:MAG: Ni/Fe hydrogenase subunit alpha [Deltaproteobacteria bacterium]